MMSLLKSVVVGTGLFALLFALSSPMAYAQEKLKSACAQSFDQCLKKCDEDFGDQTARRAACVPVCSGKFAACDAGVAYDKAKPWLEEQARKTKKLFEDLVDQYGGKEKLLEPQKKTKDNSI